MGACFPVFGVDSLGYCASVTIACCISRSSQDACRCCRRRQVATLDAPRVEQNVYGKIASRVTQMPWALVVPVLIYVVFAPAAIALFQAKFSVGGVQGAVDLSEAA